MARLREDPGLVLVGFALVAAAVIYLPVLGYGLVEHDDTWLVRDNAVLRDPSVAALGTVFFDTSAATRFLLGAEYLPIRDVTVMLDFAVWGDAYGGHHATSLAIYLVLLAVWFRALCALGVDRAVSGLAILVFAVMPVHAESIAWLSERKGLLALLFTGTAYLGYARFRAGRGTAWIVLAAASAVCAVWSKAPSAFALAALAPIELYAPAPRVSRRRSLVGLGAIAGAGMLGFVPVVITATNLAVVGTDDAAPAGRIAMAVGLHGFYAQLAAMLHPNAISYPISKTGPSAFDIVLGVLVLVPALAAAVIPARGRWRPAAAVRIAAAIWLLGYLPASRLGLPLRAVLVADRYILFASLGAALALAAALQLVRVRLRYVLIAAIVLVASLRAIDARGTWRDSLTLWQRATESNPLDGAAWSGYVAQLLEHDQPELADAALRVGLSHTREARLVLREAMIALDRGDRAHGIELLEEAARGGEPRAMANLAVLYMQSGRSEDALAWARQAVRVAPMYARGYRTLGEVALAQNKPMEAMLALSRAHALWPLDRATRYALALAMIELGLREQARPHLVACLGDPKVGVNCRDVLDQLRSAPTR